MSTQGPHEANEDEGSFAEFLFFTKKRRHGKRAQHTTRSTTREKDDR